MLCRSSWRTLVVLLLAWGIAPAIGAESAAARFTGPWKMEELKKAPPATWGAKSGMVEEVYYEGEPLDGKPTRVFAYYARPESRKGDRTLLCEAPSGPFRQKGPVPFSPEATSGPFPAMVLVHGGGGTAFREWATLWAQRGYVALAMDLAGCGPNRQRLPDGGPPQDDGAKFGNFTDAEVGRMWSYHAVAAVVRGHSLLASLPEVDPQRIGITGISWGGYLTSIVAGIDDRLKVAVPVYGCGFLHEDSAWLGRFAALTPEQRDRWVANFDPSRYLPGVSCPILFMNGTNDFAYPLDSYQKSYRLVPGRVDVRIELRMPHGHPQGWAPKEIGLYVDSVLRGGDPLPQLGPMETAEGKASARFTAKVPVVQGHLSYTTDTGPWQQRKWQSVEARIDGQTVTAELPAGRPLVYYLDVVDQRGAMVSTQHAEMP